MPEPITQLIPKAQKRGEGKMTYLFWDVYTAELYTPNGEWKGEPPYALSLTYLRDFKGVDIAKRSVKEMKEQGFDDQQKLGEWEALMSELFPNVSKGTELSGIFLENGQTSFFSEGEKLGTVEDSDFGQRFFSIWLSDKTSEPALRKQLIGESN